MISQDLSTESTLDLLLSSDAVQGTSLYFDGLTSVQIPIPVDGTISPRVTIGAWIKFPYKENVLDNIRYDL